MSEQVLVNVVGGLGNQMFQYAAGYAAAMHAGRPLAICCDTFRQYQGHQGYELDKVFDIGVRQASAQELRQQLGWLASPACRRVVSHRALGLLRPSNFISDAEVGIEHEFLSRIGVQAPYLHGYWQSETYFSQYEDELRRRYSFTAPLSDANAELAQKMATNESVAIHIRRGDYVTNPRANALHGLCDLDYYRQCIGRMQDALGGGEFFAFSDEPDWVRTNFSSILPGLHIVSHNKGGDSHFDMQLMSLCSHQIIANSTFSWWGAWLNANPSKIVMAPRRWFASGKDAAHILPGAWIKVG